jgi:hypothetical protein
MTKPRTPAQQRAHDVLAAEEFGVPAPDPRIHHGPVNLPSDPSGIIEAHDVLAAEEFALPAPRYGSGVPFALAAQRRDRLRRRVLVVALAVIALLLHKRRS